MKVSLNWLKEYVPINIDWKHLASELTIRGLEIESVEDRFNYLSSVIVGRIDSLINHPNSNELLLCSVNYGKKPISIVCSAKNPKVGMLVAVALPGTVMPNGEVVREKIIKGYTSSALLCSEYELAIGTNHNGIMEVTNTSAIGQPIKDLLSLSDPILEINVTPNRPDCCSMMGVAREVAAIQNIKMNLHPKLTDANLYKSNSWDDSMSVSMDTSSLGKCSSYLTRLFENVEVKPSPLWLKAHLISSGLKPINNVVDVTNFVMLETGQPLHVFDFDLLSGNSIVVRTTKSEEMFKTIDKKDLILSKGILTICDNDKPVAIAGIIGGFNSRVTKKTSKIVLESAYFNPTDIRIASKKLCISTESSYRFERGVDPEGLAKALERATMMINDLTSSCVVDSYIYEDIKNKKSKITIELSVKDTNRVLGTTFNLEQINFFLSSVGFFVKPEDEKLQVTVPSFRVDIERQEDLMEEVARLYGYDNIPVTLPKLDFFEPKVDKLENHIGLIKSVLNGLGFSEVINYSFIDPDSYTHLKLSDDYNEKGCLNIINPISSSQSVMRFSLLPAFLNTVKKNISRKTKSLAFFEIGNIFSLDDSELPNETEMLLALCTGPRIESSWCSEEKDYDFFDIKGNLEELLASLQVKNVYFSKISDASCYYMREGNAAKVTSPDNGNLGIVGEISSDVLKHYSIKQRIFIFEVNIKQLCKCIPEYKFAKPVPLFPAVSRDATLIVNEDMESSCLLEKIKEADEKLVEEIKLLDIFTGSSIQTGMKSISFRIVYRSSCATLDDKTVNTIHKTLINQVLNEFDVLLP